MINWRHITTPAQIDAIAKRSSEVPCVIYKHSTRCSLSSIARYRLESEWSIPDSELETYFLDLIQFRDVSAYVAERFQVYHESPQVILVSNGECVYEESHLDISFTDIQQNLPATAQSYDRR